jgi:flagellar basal-body rod protein FlgC
MGSVLDVIGSGMSANKLWMDVSTNNIANINTTRTEDGGPYKRQTIIFEEKQQFQQFFEQSFSSSSKGVEANQVVQDDKFKMAFNPEHPDANEEGYITLPAIDLTAEMTNIMMAQRGYQANVTTLNAAKEVSQKTNEIGRI